MAPGSADHGAGMSEGNSTRRGWNVTAIYSASCLLLCTFFKAQSSGYCFYEGKEQINILESSSPRAKSRKYDWTYMGTCEGV